MQRLVVASLSRPFFSSRSTTIRRVVADNMARGGDIVVFFVLLICSMAKISVLFKPQ